MKYKILSLLTIAATFLSAFGVEKLYGWGMTWMGYDLEQQVNKAKLNLGPFRANMVFYLTNAGYDSNVYRTPNNPIKDYSITAGPGFYVYLPIKKKIVISIYESPQYVYFAETKRERTWNNYFNGQVNLVLNRFFIVLGKGYSIAREIWNTELDIRPQRKEVSSQGSLLWQLSKKSSLFIRFSQAKHDYEDLSFEGSGITNQLNHTENRGDFIGYYKLSYRTRFFLNFEYAYFDFQYPSNPRDSKSYGVYSGFEFSPFGIFRGRINLGYQYFDVLTPGIKDYRGILGDTDISIKVVRPLTIRANYRRDVEFSAWYNSAFFIERIIGAGASLYLFGNIRVDYNYYLGRNSYPEAVGMQLPLGGSPQKRKVNYESQSAGIYLRIRNNTALGITATLWERDSNLWWENGKRAFVGVNLIHDFL